jgi:hypothetical protein
MGFVAVAVLLFAGYSAWRLLADDDQSRRAKYLRALLGYAVTIALGFVAFRSGLPWLLVFAVLAFLAARSGSIKQAFRRQASPKSQPVPGRSARMSAERARQILGVDDGASEREINERYRDLMRRVHPDRGGSTYLATELNEAKRVLLGR